MKHDYQLLSKSTSSIDGKGSEMEEWLKSKCCFCTERITQSWINIVCVCVSTIDSVAVLEVVGVVIAGLLRNSVMMLLKRRRNRLAAVHSERSHRQTRYTLKHKHTHIVHCFSTAVYLLFCVFFTSFYRS